MSYVTSSNLSRDAIYQTPKHGRRVKNKVKQKEQLIIQKIYTSPPPLSPDESAVLNDILETTSGVFYRKHPTLKTEISGAEKWGLIFEDKDHYVHWLQYNRLQNPSHTGFELDHLFGEDRYNE